LAGLKHTFFESLMSLYAKFFMLPFGPMNFCCCVVAVSLDMQGTLRSAQYDIILERWVHRSQQVIAAFNRYAEEVGKQANTSLSIMYLPNTSWVVAVQWLKSHIELSF
jgi:hypothetical protein